MQLFYIAGVAVPVLLLIAALAAAMRRVPRADAVVPGMPGYDQEEAKRVADNLSEAIRFQTVSFSDITQRDFTQWVNLRGFLRSRYPKVHETLASEYTPGFSSLFRWVSPEPSGDPILLCGHLDVVPAEGGWRHPPFEGRIEGGYVWGRGALDCKNVVVCLFEALESLITKGYTPSRDIYLALGHDEELGGGEGAKMFARYFAQQGLRFSMVLDEGGFISDAVFPVGKPVADVCVAEKGMVNLRLSVSAPGGHSSRPPKRSAPDLLCEAICRIGFQPRPAQFSDLIRDNLKEIAPWLEPDLRRYLASPRLYDRKLLKRLADDERTSPLVRSTAVPTVLQSGVAPNVLPATAEAILNIRLLPGDSAERTLRWIEALTRDLGIRVDVLFESPPTGVANYKGAAFRDFAAAVSDVYPGIPAVPGLFCGGTDSRHYEPFSEAVFRFSPFILTADEHATVHAENERVAVASLGAAVQFYRRVIERFAPRFETEEAE
ncbi:MAG: M20/M25/M40 family metallo-hydrolase [Oscillospiraceae bacterium]|jgi:carboxypeptidase PM20D1|nr:M20/M25/M40 family metallo-hydrolase [Oscillospiraceae bacterium]